MGRHMASQRCSAQLEKEVTNWLVFISHQVGLPQIAAGCLAVCWQLLAGELSTLALVSVSGTRSASSGLTGLIVALIMWAGRYQTCE